MKNVFEEIKEVLNHPKVFKDFSFWFGLHLLYAFGALITVPVYLKFNDDHSYRPILGESGFLQMVLSFDSFIVSGYVIGLFFISLIFLAPKYLIDVTDESEIPGFKIEEKDIPKKEKQKFRIDKEIFHYTPMMTYIVSMPLIVFDFSKDVYTYPDSDIKKSIGVFLTSTVTLYLISWALFLIMFFGSKHDRKYMEKMKHKKIWLNEHKSGTTLDLKIKPSAKVNTITGEHDGRLKVSLKAPPVDGEANSAVIDFFSDYLKVSKSSIEILRGKTSRRKTILIRDYVRNDRVSRFDDEEDL